MIRVKATRQQKLGISAIKGINLYSPKRVAVITEKIYLYKATGAGLTPNINNLRFYNSGLTQGGEPVYYDETDTYRLHFAGTVTSLTEPPTYQYSFYISEISSNSIKWNKISSSQTNSNPGFLGNYPKAFLSNAVGTVTISLI